MHDKIGLFEDASEMTRNGEKWSEKGEEYVFIPTIVDRNAKKMHPTDLENTAIPQFKIKITEIPYQNLANTANPNVPLMKTLFFCDKQTSGRLRLFLNKIITCVPCIIMNSDLDRHREAWNSRHSLSHNVLY